MQKPDAGTGGRSAKPVSRNGRKPRRRQEDRSADTRAKVIRAATECLAEKGFRGATMTAIAERAGVTWGAIQHQFREKDAVLDAVMQQALLEFEGQLAGLREAEPDVEGRVRAFVRRARVLTRGPNYRAFVEIQLYRGRAGGETARVWSRYVGDVITGVWRDLFGDLGLPKRRLEDAQRFTFAVLSGVAAEAMLFPDVDFSARHFDILEETLLRLLEHEG